MREELESNGFVFVKIVPNPPQSATRLQACQLE